MHYDAFHPGGLWLDSAGRRIRAHSAGLFRDAASGVTYWYGADSYLKEDGKRNRIINVYSSEDLYNWHYRGVAFTFWCKQASPGHKTCYCDRPKVVRNADGIYVMWMKATPWVAVATADAPVGPFRFAAQWLPNNEPMGDPTAFMDPVSGRGYWVYSVSPTTWPSGVAHRRVVRICLMTPDLLNISSVASTIYQPLEAPAVFYEPALARYYVWNSHCSGWAPNAAAAFSSTTLHGGGWAEEGNPTHHPTSFASQSTYILQLDMREGARFIYIADRFKADMLSDPESGRYVWLPLHVRDGRLQVRWRDSWTLGELGTPIASPPPDWPPAPPARPPKPPPLPPPLPPWSPSWPPPRPPPTPSAPPPSMPHPPLPPPWSPPAPPPWSPPPAFPPAVPPAPLQPLVVGAAAAAMVTLLCALLLGWLYKLGVRPLQIWSCNWAPCRACARYERALQTEEPHSPSCGSRTRSRGASLASSAKRRDPSEQESIEMPPARDDDGPDLEL